MKNLTYFFLLISFFSFSQSEIPVIDFVSGDYPMQEKVRINFDKDLRPTINIDSTLYYRLITFKEKNIPVGKIEGYYITGELYDKGYSSYAGLNSNGIDSITYNGPYYKYYKNGNRSLAFFYMNGSLFGDYFSYYESGEVEHKRNFVDGLAQGEDISYYESGEVQYTANYVDDKLQGEQIGYYESGKLKNKRNYVDDKLQGELIGYYKSGQTDDNIASDAIAKGEEVNFIKYYNNGDYLGEKIFSLSGSVIYDNTESLDTKKFYYPSGSIRSITEMKNKQENGQEIGYYESGEILVNMGWLDGLRQGERIESYKSGKLKNKSNYIDGKLQGEEIGYYESGEVQNKRNYVDDKIQGEEIGYYESGEVQYTVNYVDGLAQGEGISYYKSGEFEYKRNYVDDKIQGEEIGYYESGEVQYTANYVDDLVQGEGISYYESGEFEYKRNYVDGLIQGEEIGYYESGEVQYTVNYVDDLVQGEGISYYESGEVQNKRNFVDDKLQGEVIGYYKSGEVQYTVNFVDGLRQGEGIGYYKSGELQYTVNYVDDLKQGEQIYYKIGQTKDTISGLYIPSEIDYTRLWLDDKIKERRIALVIGNAAYEKGPLENPVNDANLITESLEKLDFEVFLHTDLATEDEMLDAIKDFGRKRKNYDIGFVYYAGHGIQLNNENYLLPVSEEFEYEDDVEDNAVSMQRVLRYLESAGENQLNFIVLDACRDNPFESNWNKTRSLKGAGLAKTSPPTGSLIAFSTDHGQTAADGDGGNSLYSQVLAEKLLEENVSIEQVFKNVRTEVLKLSRDKQSPVEESKLTGNIFYLNKKSE